MKIELTPMEARVIGCLIEKQITTPDQYPLSLNALVNACNQKSNRDPLMDVSESEVQKTLDGLSKKHFILERSGFGSRVPKYQHRFCNTEFGTLKFTPQELAIVVELLLRGPQTPGELRTRGPRLAPFSEATDAEAVLETLAKREDGPFVVRLSREPGRRDSRWAHLFSGPVADMAPASESARAGYSSSSAYGGSASSASTGSAASVPAASAAGGASASSASGAGSFSHRSTSSTDAGELSAALSRIDHLEAEVRLLRTELDALKQSLGV